VTTLGTDKVNDTHIDWGTGANQVSLDDMPDKSYFIDQPLSPMILTGGEVSTGTNAGTYKVAALTALLRTTDSVTGTLAYVSLTEQDNQPIAATSTTYFVSLNYNGGSPTISLSETNSYVADKRSINLGKVMKNTSNSVHYVSGGFGFRDGIFELHRRAGSLRGHELMAGSAIAYSGTNNFTMTAGVSYVGINRIIMDSYNSASTTFRTVYSDGDSGWIDTTASTTIDFAHYDDGDGELGEVGTAKYGVFWVYRHVGDQDVYVRYGVSGSYSLAAAEEAQEPAKPDHLTDFGLLVGKIIVPYNGGSFTVQMVTDIMFTGTAVSDHNALSDLQGGTADQYYHLTSADYTELTAWIDDVTLGVSGALTIPTGQNFLIGTTQWNSADEIDGTKIKDADYGDITIDAAGDWQVSEGEVDHDTLLNFVAGEHFLQSAITEVGTIATGTWEGDAINDSFIASSTEYLADNNTTYTATGTLLDLTSEVFGVNEGTLTTGKGCIYTSGTGLVCDSDFLTSTALTNYMQDEDVNTFSELQAWVTDEVLIASSSINTFAELDNIVANKTLINEEDAVQFDSTVGITGTLTINTGLTGVLRADSGVVSTTTVGSGTVTSVDFSVPTGLTIANNPITTSGTLALDYDAGYSAVKDASTTEWATAYGWGDWSGEGFLTDITGENLFDLSDVAADPNADRFLMWDDDPGTNVWHQLVEADISDLSHLATAITDGLIIEADLNADEEPADNDILTFDTTGDNFSWQTPTELGLLYSGGTLTDTQICVADGTSGGIDCNIASTYYVQDGCTDCLNATEIEDIYLLYTGGTLTGATYARDHGTAAVDELINVSYGTGEPPTATSTTIGSIFIKYTE